MNRISHVETRNSFLSFLVLALNSLTLFVSPGFEIMVNFFLLEIVLPFLGEVLSMKKCLIQKSFSPTFENFSVLFYLIIGVYPLSLLKYIWPE